MRISVRSIGLDASETLHGYAEKRAYFALARMAQPLSAVSVQLLDLNGPKGGIDKCCRIVMRGPRQINVVEATDADPYAAVDRACARIASVVRKTIDRTRTAHDRGRRAAKIAS